MDSVVMAEMMQQSDANMPEYFLGHLASLAARQAASPSPKERAALSVAMFSTFLECLDLGLGGEAQQIMAQLRYDSRMMELVAA
jgi:hypothetical protein